MTKSWILTVEEAEDGSGDGVLIFPQDLLDETNWKEGDNLIWEIHDDGTVSLSKQING